MDRVNSTKNGLGTMILQADNSNQSGNAWQINNGILQINANVNLGDPVQNGQIVAGSAPNTSTGTSSYNWGGTLRVAGTMSTNRIILPNSNTTTSLDVDVTSTNVLTQTGVISNNGTATTFTLVKTGTGSFINNQVDTEAALTVQNGTFQSSGTQPWGLSTSTLPTNVTVNGGDLALVNLTGSQVVSAGAGTTNLNYDAGGHFQLQAPASGAFTETVNFTNINRGASGTLVLDPLSPLGTGAADSSNVVPLNVLGVSVASAPNNGILAPSIITEGSGGVGDFLTTGSFGLVPWNGTTNAVTSLSGTNPTLIGNITAPQSLTGTNSIYALVTTANISGGTLKITSVNTTTNEGGILINGSNTISSNLTFDPTTAATGAVSGEGLLYVAPSMAATISGNILANSFVKYGSGSLTLSGASDAILGTLTVEEGTLKLGALTNFNNLQTDLVLNNNGVVDLNGRSSTTFDSLGNSLGSVVASQAPMGGLITNTGGTAAVLNITYSPVAGMSAADSVSQTGTTAANQTITALTSTADLFPGMPVFGTTVAGGSAAGGTVATIKSIDSATQIQITSTANNTAGTQTLYFGPIYFGQIADGTGGAGAGDSVSLVKSGLGVLALGGYNPQFPDAGNNSYSGGTTLNQGTLLVESPLALGGFVTTNNPSGTAGGGESGRRHARFAQ